MISRLVIVCFGGSGVNLVLSWRAEFLCLSRVVVLLFFSIVCLLIVVTKLDLRCVCVLIFCGGALSGVWFVVMYDFFVFHSGVVTFLGCSCSLAKYKLAPRGFISLRFARFSFYHASRD